MYNSVQFLVKVSWFNNSTPIPKGRLKIIRPVILTISTFKMKCSCFLLILYSSNLTWINEKEQVSKFVICFYEFFRLSILTLLKVRSKILGKSTVAKSGIHFLAKISFLVLRILLKWFTSLFTLTVMLVTLVKLKETYL